MKFRDYPCVTHVDYFTMGSLLSNKLKLMQLAMFILLALMCLTWSLLSTRAQPDPTPQEPTPNTIGVFFECGKAIIPPTAPAALFVRRALDTFFQHGTEYMNLASFPYNRVIMLKLYGWQIFRMLVTVSCYGGRATMNSTSQCWTCLEHVKNETLTDLCPSHRSAERLVIDCFLSYTLDDPTFCRPIPPDPLNKAAKGVCGMPKNPDLVIA